MISIISSQILQMFLMMAVGFLFYRRKLITLEGSKSLSNVALFAVVPCVVFSAFQIAYTPDVLKALVEIFILTLIGHLIPIFLSYVFVRGENLNRVVIERFNLVYPNCGFMGIPIAQAMYGNKGVVYITAFIAAQNVLVWSHGVSIMNGGYQKGGWKNIITAPVMIATFLGIAFFLLQVKVPGLILRPIQSIGSMNTPLAMLIAGSAIAQTDILSTLKKGRIYYIALLRLIVLPMILLVILAALDLPMDVKRITLLGASAPTAAVSTMFAVKYDKDVGYAAELFAFITVWCVASMPFLFWVADCFF